METTGMETTALGICVLQHRHGKAHNRTNKCCKISCCSLSCTFDFPLLRDSNIADASCHEIPWLRFRWKTTSAMPSAVFTVVVQPFEATTQCGVFTFLTFLDPTLYIPNFSGPNTFPAEVHPVGYLP